MQQLDSKCKLSQRAQLLLAVSDQAAAAGDEEENKEGGTVRLRGGSLPEVHKVRHSGSHHQHSHRRHNQQEDTSQHWLLG